jgi:hypothetical protein
MSEIQVAIWLSIVLVVELIAVFVAFYLFTSERDDDFHILLKAGLAMLVFGLLVQVVRSMHYLNVGSYPVDYYFPMWITKDIGACILIYYYAFVHKKG